MAVRLVAIVAAVMVSAFIGTLAGNATVAGMNGLGQGAMPPAIGDERVALAGLPEDPTAWTPPDISQPQPPLAAIRVSVNQGGEDCVGCSDFEAGYRWAAAHELIDAAACDEDGTSFAAGCAAYVGDGITARDS